MNTNKAYSRTNIDFVHHNFSESENLSYAGKLLKAAILGYYALAVAKSAAERGNSNISQTANSSTPFNRAFFVCSIRTPKENALSILLSMVGRNGQRLIVGCIPFEAVFHPVMLYRQAWKLAVVPKSFQTELSPMIYLFKAVSRLDLRKTQKPFTSFPHYTLKVQADSVEQAQAKISRLFAVLSVAVVKNFAKNPQNPTACDTEQNHSLPSVGGCGYDGGTTKKLNSVNRKRYSSGIFLPKIHQYHGLTTPVIHSELAVRATPRTKADSIRTNKGGGYLLSTVVEPLSPLFSDKSLSLTRKLNTMKKPTQTGTTATTTPIVRSPRFEGVAYA